MTAQSDQQPSNPDRVLLVDDNLDNLQVLYQALEDEGYELLVAQSGAEALATARRTTPALILLDINMPEMDGYETCRQLKADPVTAPAVVVFLSAKRALDDKLTGFDCGAVDYIEKPFQFEEVVARVRTQLASYHRERQLEDAAQEAAASKFRDLQPASLAEIMAGGENEVVEFKSTLRFNLHAGKPDKRMENACLKTIAAYLNSDGGLLLVGVNDDGEAVGMEADKFANEDKLLLHITSLVRNHLGGEFSPNVRYAVHSPDGMTVLSVDCLPSPEPVYFRREQEEVFYVRSGPSTQQLSPSEIVAYVNNRAG
jgi:DNA-binding response OmpR family regulator